MKAKLLVTVEEYEIGSEDRVFFAHQDHSSCGEPLTNGTNAGWYWQSRGYPDAYGPFQTRELAEHDYEMAEKL